MNPVYSKISIPFLSVAQTSRPSVCSKIERDLATEKVTFSKEISDATLGKSEWVEPLKN